MRPSGFGTGGDRRVVIRPVVTEYSARLPILGLRSLQVLVGDLYLLFQCIKARVLKNLPPVSAEVLVVRLSCLPVALLFVRWGRWSCRDVVLRSDRASRKWQNRNHDRNQIPDKTCTANPVLSGHHFLSPGNVAETISTSCPDTSESGGLRMT